MVRFPNMVGAFAFGAARLARLATAAGFGMAMSGAPAPAQDYPDFLAGQSKGMNRCVRAILSGNTAKRVNVHGHHFNCHSLRRWDAHGRTILLSRNVRFAEDDQYGLQFMIDRFGTREMVRAGSVRIIVYKGGLSWQRLRDFSGLNGFAVYDWPPRNAGWAYFARSARKIEPREQKRWRSVANQIATIVLAQLGLPKE